MIDGSEKTCSKCLCTRPTNEFCRSNRESDGLQDWCKYCNSEYRSAHSRRISDYQRKYRLKRKGALKEYQRHYRHSYYRKNKDALTLAHKKYYSEHRIETRSRQREYAATQGGRAKMNRKVAKHRAAKRQAIPAWVDGRTRLGKQINEHIESRFKEARTMRQVTGIEHHVDHIVPLQSCDPETGERNASGLHVPWNMRVIPASQNCSKANKLISSVGLAPNQAKIYQPI